MLFQETPKLIKYQDWIFRDYKQLCLHLHIPYKSFLKRQQENPKHSIDQWLYGEEWFELNGVIYNSTKHCCRKNKIPYVIFKQLQQNMSHSSNVHVLNALLAGVRPYDIPLKHTVKTLRFRGKGFKDEKALCAYYAVNYKLFKSRKETHTHETLEFWLMGEDIHIKFRGEYYRSWRDLCDAYGADEGYFLYLRSQYPDKDIEFWLFERHKGYVVNGTHFRNAFSLCKAYGKSTGSFANNRKNRPRASVYDWLFGCSHNRPTQPLHPIQKEWLYDESLEGQQVNVNRAKEARKKHPTQNAHLPKEELKRLRSELQPDILNRAPIELPPLSVARLSAAQPSEIHFNGVLYPNEPTLCLVLGVRVSEYYLRQSNHPDKSVRFWLFGEDV